MAALSLIATARHRDGPVIDARWIDADRLLSVAERDVPRLWTREGGAVAALGPPDDSSVEDAAAGPDGLIVTWQGAEVTLWDRDGHRRGGWSAAAQVRQVQLGRAGVAVIESGDTTIRIVDLPTGAERRRWWRARDLAGTDDRIAFVRQDSIIVAGIDGTERATARLPSLRPLAMPTPALLVLGERARTSLLATDDLRPLTVFPGLSPTGLRIAGVGSGISLWQPRRALVVIDARSGATRGALDAPVRAFCWGGKDLLLIALSDGRLGRWLPGAAGAEILADNLEAVSAILQIGRAILVGDERGQLCRLEAPAVQAHQGEVLGLHRHPRDPVVVSRGRDGRLGFWRCE